MNRELNGLIRYRVARAREAIDEARVLADSGHWNACVNRLYYACFYAVSALLSKREISSSKHSGVRSLFNRNFVRCGLFPKETAVIYNSLFERRQEGDYEVFVTFKESEAKPWLTEAEAFVDAAIRLIDADSTAP